MEATSIREAMNSEDNTNKVASEVSSHIHDREVLEGNLSREASEVSSHIHNRELSEGINYIQGVSRVNPKVEIKALRI